MLWVLINITSVRQGDSNEYAQHVFMGEVILMSTHNIWFYGEIAKIIPKLSSNTLLICPTGILLWLTSWSLSEIYFHSTLIGSTQNEQNNLNSHKTEII